MEYRFLWTISNSKKGDKIILDKKNIEIYGSTIADYEKNSSFKIENNKVFIDDNQINEYTFKQNYYFMMGDNRDNSDNIDNREISDHSDYSDSSDNSHTHW